MSERNEVRFTDELWLSTRPAGSWVSPCANDCDKGFVPEDRVDEVASFALRIVRLFAFHLSLLPLVAQAPPPVGDLSWKISPHGWPFIVPSHTHRPPRSPISVRSFALKL